MCYRTTKIRLWVLLLIALFATGSAVADDWPTYQHDKYRSGRTAEQLQLPLKQRWAHTGGKMPRSAWTETPALQDFWQNTYEHKSRLPIENAYRTVVKDGRLFFASASSDKLVCLNARTGAKLWQYFAEGPIRFSPTAYGDKVYFGSDDGYVYCLKAADGSLVWRNRAVNSDELMFIDGRMVSVCPVRTAVLVDGGVAYWSAGLFSGARTGLSRFVVACNADSGLQLWKKTPPKPLQGYPLASSTNLYIPSGKSTPVFFRRSDGGYLGDFNASGSRQGGTYAILSEDNKFYYGPHYSGSGSYIGKYDANTRSAESVAWGPGNHLVVTSQHAYYSSDTTIAKIDRSSKAIVWKVASRYPFELVLAGDTLFAGGDDEVAAISTADGSKRWSAAVNGRVRGLAVAGGSLFVSTDTGAIYCFVQKLLADIDGDEKVDLSDFSIMAHYWLYADCGMCGGADIRHGDSMVNLDDLTVLFEDWGFN